MSNLRNRLALTVLFVIFFIGLKAQTNFDIYIKNACVFDGSLNDSTFKDIGIKADKIVYLGKPISKIKANKIIDVQGKYVSPGFIDLHTHADSALNSSNSEQRANLLYLSQGITTVFLGNDGWGDYHVAKQFEKFKKNGIGTNVAIFVGFGPVRQAVMTNDNRLPTKAELDRMKTLVNQAMKQGAIGISTGLSYIPQNFSSTHELIELSKVVASYGGTYDTHIRNQSTGSIKAIEENLEIGRNANIPIHISHLKASGVAAQGMSTEIIAYIQKAINSSQNVTASVYPYLAAGDDLNILIPTWAKRTGVEQMLRNFNNPDSLKVIKEWTVRRIAALGGADKLRLYFPKDELYHGKTLAQLSNELHKNSEDVAIAALTKHPTIEVHSFVMIQSDLDNFIKQAWMMTCSDGVYGHPRAAGSFVKKIREFVLDRKLLSMKQAIYSSTGLTADFFRLKNRGYIKVGNYADIVVFNPKTIKDNATYSQPYELATGIDEVIINGKLVIEEGKYNHKLLGKILTLK